MDSPMGSENEVPKKIHWWIWWILILPTFGVPYSYHFHIVHHSSTVPRHSSQGQKDWKRGRGCWQQAAYFGPRGPSGWQMLAQERGSHPTQNYTECMAGSLICIHNMKCMICNDLIIYFYIYIDRYTHIWMLQIGTAASWEIIKVNVFCSLLCLIIWVWNNDISIYDAYIWLLYIYVIIYV